MTDKTSKIWKTALASLALFFSMNLSAQETAAPEFQNPPMNFETLVGTGGGFVQVLLF
ncbi:hypothetical protein MTP09_10305 [Chryseobacterium suipulveris]|uniref:Uncharacterized protein n=1 Tax=Chryseobacterium suipulveris TaxID=2929800 RepID=A0ABY4BRB9_9FLAO|nr:hypothetical protein [Chryseobacterium suipulveris]UOE40301.1 hypothetical protein MTP09_10305 [Chryseobacterium suipulveris]